MGEIFIFEHTTGGGWLGSDASPPDSLLREGAAMAAALALDFAKAGSRPVLLRDARLDDDIWMDRLAALTSGGLPMVQLMPVESADETERCFSSLAANSEEMIIIAPECDGVLLEWVSRAARRRWNLLSPHPEFVQLAADKQATAERLGGRGVPVPQGIALGRGDILPQDFRFPAVLKPRDGAGSLGIRFLNAHPAEELVVDQPSRLERYIPGMAASVAVLYGRDGLYEILPACSQRLSHDGRMTYLGGTLPLSPDLNARAQNLVQQAIAALPRTIGYVGFDLVLGDAADGSRDAVIEVNPRLTTSYVGLRAACQQNLAAAMLDLAAGRTPALSFSTNPLEFDPEGKVAGSLGEPSAAF